MMTRATLLPMPTFAFIGTGVRTCLIWGSWAIDVAHAAPQDQRTVVYPGAVNPYILSRGLVYEARPPSAGRLTPVFLFGFLFPPRGSFRCNPPCSST
jgi:hypothetical protein